MLVDDHLIGSTDLVRRWFAAAPSPDNPVLRPETPWELNDGYCPVACPFNDGVWFDPADRQYKLFYHAGWFHGTALATSDDGRHWRRPGLDAVPGTNLVVPLRPGHLRDGSTVWLDPDADDPAERYKLFLFNRVPGPGDAVVERPELWTAPDGIHWTLRGDTPPVGDNSGFFFDPFRRQWVFSVRVITAESGRVRHRVARDRFVAPPWQPEECLPWLGCDPLDRPDPAVGERPELYDFNAVAYESVMLGLFGVFYGPNNEESARRGQPKIIDLHVGFSRDGVQWERPPERTPFLAASRVPGAWDRGYLHAAGGVCLVFEDRLRFYYGGFSGQSRLSPGEAGPHGWSLAMYAGGATGYAELRRDGFAAMAGTGELLTRPLSGLSGTLYINAVAAALRCQVETAEGAALPGYTLAESVPFRGDTVNHPLIWRNRSRLPDTRAPLRLRFQHTTGELYAFWGSTRPKGASGGHLAAGSADYAALRDF